ncbi:zinc-ribbon domain-containing protein [Donghicola mangrovi]|uniref:Thioredoxin n=1 Tax=Donghicola mangrovi TaxID=2729614 RepID=A0A850PYC8_9RHOB|nr:zinc-ribbon domain-containing protein [Donghicola mangrovi]NVO21836.1 thioredoxin [Donghicola mangrovi]
MRLTCPNCDAQYEVPDNVIPDDGRDVQCSNCAHTWFQMPADWQADDSIPADDEIPLDMADFAEEPEDSPEDDTEVDENDLSPEEFLDRLEQEETTEIDVPMDAAMGATAAGGLPRRELDPMVREVLRQEAEYEAERRARADAGLESQPELGLDQPVRKRIIPADIPSLREKEAKEAAMVAEAADANPEPEHKSRRDLLPDVEDINSTLRKREVRSVRTPGELMEDPEEVAQRGFRSGFFLSLIFALLFAMFYVKADALSQSLPSAAPALASYVESVDSVRVWLDTKVRGAAGWLDGFSSEAKEG